MAILKKTLFDEHLENINVLVKDTAPLSRYFKISELPTAFTGGKNAFLIQGSSELVLDTIVKIQIRDAQGKIIFHEPGNGIPEYYEGTSKVVSIYVYPDTSFGPCTITILGELKEYTDPKGFVVPVPDIWKDTYNVKWETQVNVNPSLPNTTKIRFYRRPKLQITESVLPIYNRAVTNKTISGSVKGVPITPSAGEDYRSFKGALQYQLQMLGDSQFSQSMEGQPIVIGGLNGVYSPIITTVTSDKNAFVGVPYYVTTSAYPSYQSVTGFAHADFTLTYEEDVLLSNSSVSSSFATINITDLETFAGDAYRIKVYASSRNDLGDFVLLEDIQLESNELLMTSSFDAQLNVRTGLFTDLILPTFWTSSALDTNAVLSVDHSLLLKSAVLTSTTDHSSSVGLFKFLPKDNLTFTKNTEYQLDFTPLLTSASAGVGIIEVYLSGSAFVNTTRTDTYGKKIGVVSTPTSYKKYEKQQINFKPEVDGDGKLVFIVKSGVWQLADISLRAAQESAFSPNEITLTVNVPVKINNETFDFRFEIYDINNNYVPVKIEGSHTFTGGNDLVVRRALDLNVSNTAFNFSTGSSFPQLITVYYTTSGLTGSVSFTSQSIDINGNLISATPQPGTLSTIDINTKTLPIESFTGSLVGTTVGAISYTASCEDVRRYFTIFRIDQGAAASLFYATADKNNFTFDPDDRYKSVVTDDYIDIRLVQQNLPAYFGAGLEIGSGSELLSPPPLNFITSIGNADIYRLWVTSSAHPSTLDGYSYGIGQSHYDFSSTTTYGVFTSSVTIDAVLKGDKGKGLFASTDRNQFFYKMTDLTPFPAAQTSTILVKRQNLGLVSSTITVLSGSGAPALTVGGNISGVTTYTVDTSTYSYPNGETKYIFTSHDLNGTAYTDEITIAALIAESQISVNLSNENVTLPAKSTGFVASNSFVLTSGSVTVKIGTEDIARQEGLSSNNRWDIISATGTNCTPINVAPNDSTYAISDLSADSGSLSLLVRYRDGRGTTTDVAKVVTYSKAKTAAPTTIAILSSETQNILSSSTGFAVPHSFTVNATEGAGNYSYDAGLGSNSTFYVSSITGGSNSSGTITPTTPVSVSGTTVSLVASYKNSEGTSGTISKTHIVSVATAGTDGLPGASGSNGISGSNGARTATGLVYNQLILPSAPASPTATSYTYSNGTFSGLTANWATSAPTYQSGNSNKYWYATYTAVETSPGSGIGTPSFSAPIQAIGFSGLVTFTSANNVSDGTNALSFGSAGTTTINGGQITTGIIKSTGFSGTDDGSGYSTTGTAFNLVNGTISTPNFRVAADGSIVINGTINVTGGNASTQAFASSASAAAQSNAALDATTKSGNAYSQSVASASLYSGYAATSASVSASAAYIAAVSSASVMATSSSNAAYNSSTALLQTLADGHYSGSFIGSTTIYSPNIGGQNGYISNILRVGSGGAITLDGGNKMIYVGTGQYANTNTSFYVDNYNNFSLGDKLTWNGTTLNITGNINIVGGNAATTSSVNTAAANAVTSGSNASANAVTSGSNASANAVTSGSLYAGNAATSASVAQGTANSATASAASAQGPANSATASAASAQSTANAATASAAAAQSTANAATASVNTLSNNVFTNQYGNIVKAPVPTTGGSGLYLGNDHLGFYNGSAWKSWMDASGHFYLAGATGYGLSWDGTSLLIDGAGTFSGNLSAAGGTFSGNLSAAGGTFTGSLSAASGTFTGALSGGTISIGTGNAIFKADTNGIYLGNATFASAPFSVSPAGALTATNASISGSINATGGTFTNSITVNGNLNAGGVQFGKNIGPGSTHTGIYIDAYNYWYDTSAFSVGDASNAMTWAPGGATLNLKGNLTATGAATITGATIQTAATGKRVKMTSDGTIQFYSAADGALPSLYLYSNDAGPSYMGLSGGGYIILQGNGSHIEASDASAYIQIGPNAGPKSIINDDYIESPAFYENSDKRLKKNIEDIPLDTINKLISIKFKQFVFKTDGTGRIRYGVVAQDIVDEFPELVMESDKDKMLNVDYTSLLILKIEALEKRISELESKNDNK